MKAKRNVELRDVNADAISCETIREIVTVPVVVFRAVARGAEIKYPVRAKKFG